MLVGSILLSYCGHRPQLSLRPSDLFSGFVNAVGRVGHHDLCFLRMMFGLGVRHRIPTIIINTFLSPPPAIPMVVGRSVLPDISTGNCGSSANQRRSETFLSPPPAIPMVVRRSVLPDISTGNCGSSANHSKEVGERVQESRVSNLRTYTYCWSIPYFHHTQLNRPYGIHWK